MKYLILSAMLSVAPMTAFAQVAAPPSQWVRPIPDDHTVLEAMSHQTLVLQQILATLLQIQAAPQACEPGLAQ